MVCTEARISLTCKDTPLRTEYRRLFVHDVCVVTDEGSDDLAGSVFQRESTGILILTFCDAGAQRPRVEGCVNKQFPGR